MWSSPILVGSIVLEGDSMRSLTIALIAALVAAIPLHAANKDADVQSTRSEQQSKRPTARAEKPAETKDNTQQCKEQAHGLSGPERSRFMTKCLRQG
jgi:hypothetical protein